MLCLISNVWWRCVSELSSQKRTGGAAFGTGAPANCSSSKTTAVLHHQFSQTLITVHGLLRHPKRDAYVKIHASAASLSSRYARPCVAPHADWRCYRGRVCCSPSLLLSARVAAPQCTTEHPCHWCGPALLDAISLLLFVLIARAMGQPATPASEHSTAAASLQDQEHASHRTRHRIATCTAQYAGTLHHSGSVELVLMMPAVQFFQTLQVAPRAWAKRLPGSSSHTRTASSSQVQE